MSLQQIFSGSIYVGNDAVIGVPAEATFMGAAQMANDPNYIILSWLCPALPGASGVAVAMEMHMFQWMVNGAVKEMGYRPKFVGAFASRYKQNGGTWNPTTNQYEGMIYTWSSTPYYLFETFPQTSTVEVKPERSIEFTD